MTRKRKEPSQATGLRLPETIFAEVAQLARRDGISFNRWVSRLVREKVEAERKGRNSGAQRDRT